MTHVTKIPGHTLDLDFLSLLRVPVRRGGDDYPELGDGRVRTWMWDVFCHVREKKLLTLPDAWRNIPEEVDWERAKEMHAFYQCPECHKDSVWMFC